VLNISDVKAESQAEAAPGLPKFALMPMSCILLIHIALQVLKSDWIVSLGTVCFFSPNLISPLLWLVILARSCFVRQQLFHKKNFFPKNNIIVLTTVISSIYC
jgi:hypothetical protein